MRRKLTSKKLMENLKTQGLRLPHGYELTVRKRKKTTKKKGGKK